MAVQELKKVVKAPKRSNYNLSHKVRMSAAPGIIYPVLKTRILPWDKLKFNVGSLIKTFPLLAPVMGSLQVRFYMFFAPDRIYMPEYDDNTPDFAYENISYPYIRVRGVTSDVVTELNGPESVDGGDVFENNGIATDTLDKMRWLKETMKYGVAPSSLMNFLDFPSGFCNLSSSTKNFNGFGHLMYYDVVRNYFVNQQEGIFYKFGRSIGSATSSVWSRLRSYPLSTLDDYVTKVHKLTGSGSYTKVVDTYDFNVSRTDSRFDDLCLACYKPDYFTQYLNTDKVNTLTTRARMNVVNNALTYDQIISGSKVYQLVTNGILGGGRFGEWMSANWAVDIAKDLRIPQFLGSVSTNITFDDVISTSNVRAYDAEAEQTGLGQRGGRGDAASWGRTRYFNFYEYGTFMVMMTIIPRVDYYQGVSKFATELRMTDTFVPAMDGIGYQDVTKSEMCALPESSIEERYIEERDTNGNLKTAIHWDVSKVPNWGTSGSVNDPFAQGLAKQPAWAHYTTAVNRVYGEFADSLRYWTITRDYNHLSLERSLIRATDTTGKHLYLTSNVGYLTTSFNPTTYVLPNDYNYLFVDTSPTAENYHVQIKFDMLMKRGLSKRINPHV